MHRAVVPVQVYGWCSTGSLCFSIYHCKVDRYARIKQVSGYNISNRYDLFCRFQEFLVYLFYYCVPGIELSKWLPKFTPQVMRQAIGYNWWCVRHRTFNAYLPASFTCIFSAICERAGSMMITYPLQSVLKLVEPQMAQLWLITTR